MEKMTTKFSPFLWFSGFFALGAIVHLIRFIFRLNLMVAGREVPLAVSGYLVLGFGVLSIWLWIVPIKK